MLLNDSTPLEIFTCDSHGPFYVQQALLASVSPELAAQCLAGLPLRISNDAFRIVAIWLLFRDLEKADCENADWLNQFSLAEVWKFGETFKIPKLQNAAMQSIGTQLDNALGVEPDAVKEVYRNTGPDSMLRKAYIAYLACDMGETSTYNWTSAMFSEHKMDKVQGFYLDLILAVSVPRGQSVPKPDIGDYMVCEDDE